MNISVFALVTLLSGVGVSVGAWTVHEGSLPPTRRAMLAGGATAFLGALTTLPPTASATGYRLGDPNSVVGREIRSFNGLVNEFKNTSLDGGLDASKLNEPSVPFTEFGEKMRDGKVEFVEFIAPNGDAAYVTFKPEKGKGSERVRIGQGYPTSSSKSWSSPEYVIRSVSNFGVPYAFTVPGLATYRNKK